MKWWNLADVWGCHRNFLSSFCYSERLRLSAKCSIVTQWSASRFWLKKVGPLQPGRQQKHNTQHEGAPGSSGIPTAWVSADDPINHDKWDRTQSGAKAAWQVSHECKKDLQPCFINRDRKRTKDYQPSLQRLPSSNPSVTFSIFWFPYLLVNGSCWDRWRSDTEEDSEADPTDRHTETHFTKTSSNQTWTLLLKDQQNTYLKFWCIAGLHNGLMVIAFQWDSLQFDFWIRSISILVSIDLRCV